MGFFFGSPTSEMQSPAMQVIMTAMASGLVDDPSFERHDTGGSHPESPRRLQAIRERLQRDHLYEQFQPITGAPAGDVQLRRVHDPAYLERLQQACSGRYRFLDSRETPICPESFEIAQRAAGSVLAAVDAVMAGKVANALCLVRPPGHHASANQGSGFCLINHVALAACHLIEHHKLSRVAIVDFDVHHGNGTQEIFQRRSDVLFISLHGHPTQLYPGTGFGWETGKGEGKGFTLNLPIEAGADDAVYLALTDLRVLPALHQFEPQFILLSSGFDAAADDPLADMKMSPEGYAALTRKLMQAADRHCDGSLVSVLEGGYNLRSLAECAASHARTLLAGGDHDLLMSMKAGL